ncbi:MAG: ATP-grasp domain-containing protein [Candidatus Pacebacteria bacterium]|nr:ATP-grasp domain-containing protein [Candidatus Paceibacterota bacterium]
MKFYCVNSDDQDVSYLAFKNICDKKGIEFVTLNPLDTNLLSLNVQKGDLVYRIAPNNKAANFIEKEVLYKGAIGFYRCPSEECLLEGGLLAYFKNQELPSPKTINVITENKETLKEYVDFLGGFPIILKVLGGSKGFGVMKIESFESLFSIIDYFKEDVINKGIILREFIEHDKQIRAIVLGDNILFNYSRIREEDDFRTNSKKTTKEVTQVSEEIKNIAINSVKNMNVEFGGVDILIEKKTGKPYLAEVNFPCSLKIARELAKQNDIEIEESMLNFLIDKSNRLSR